MQWSEPGFDFRITFSKVNYKEQKETNDYARLRTITDDYGRFETEEKKILLYLPDNEKMSRKEAVELLGLGKSKVFNILNSLTKEGYLERRGKGRSTYYVLKEKKSER